MESLNLIGRSRSERLLDRIYNEQSQKIRRHLQARALARKRKAVSRPKAEKQRTPPVPVKERTAEQVTLGAAIGRISPYLKNGQKFPKAIKIALEMATSNLSNDSAELFLEFAWKVGNSEFCTTAAAQTDVASFFRLLLLRAQGEGLVPTEDRGEPIFDPEQSKLLDCLSIRGFVQNSLHTDDTYEFNAQCDTLLRILSTVQTEVHELALEEATSEPESPGGEEEGQVERPTSSEQEPDEKRRRMAPSAADDVKPEEGVLPEGDVKPESDGPSLSREELASLRRQNFVSALGGVFAARSKPWARSSIDRVFSNAYRQRELFSPEEQRQIEAWQQCLKSKKGARFGADVLGIGESANPVKDAREEKISTLHGSVVWSAKQAGL